MSLRAGIAIVGLLACSTRLVSAQAVVSTRVAERVVDHSLADAAVAISDPLRPIVYYNPVILQRIGTAMAAFILAHEDAHIQLRHIRIIGGVVDPSRLRRLELEADCVAARTLAPLQSESVRAAARFFGALGELRVDEFHPSGVERARRILACAESTEPGEASRPRPVDADAPDLPDVR